MDILEAVKDLGKEIFDSTKEELKDDLKGLLKEDLDIVKECSQRAAKLSILKMRGVDVSEDIKWINFSLMSIAHLKANNGRRIFWATVNKVVTKSIQGTLTLLVALV